MIYGMDSLFAPMYPKLAIRSLPDGWALGTFHGLFRDRNGNLERLFHAPKFVERLLTKTICPVVRINILWDDGHLYGLPGDAKILKREVRKYQEIAEKWPDRRIEIAPFCETGPKFGNPDKWLDIVAEAAPSCFPVNSVWQGSFSNKYKNEVHNSKEKPFQGSYNFSWDGVTVLDADIERSRRKHKNCDIYFLWSWQDNRKANKHDPTPRAERKVKPRLRLKAHIAAHAQEKGKTELPSGWLYKSSAEQKENPSDVDKKRACKPLFLAPKGTKTKKVFLKTRAGERIATFTLDGLNSDGRPIYRHYKQYGHQLAAKAIRLQGDAVCEVFAGKDWVGHINPIFRENEYRNNP